MTDLKAQLADLREGFDSDIAIYQQGGDRELGLRARGKGDCLPLLRAFDTRCDELVAEVERLRKHLGELVWLHQETGTAHLPAVREAQEALSPLQPTPEATHG